MALPQFLLVELRLAFRSCARRYRNPCTRSLSSTSARPEQRGPKAPSWPYNGAIPPQKASEPRAPRRRDARGQNAETDIVPQQRDRNAIDTGRRVPVPMKVIPKADIAPDVRLTPRERLHIEVLTRRQPQKTEKKIYRERLQIYHMGALKENVMAVLKVSGIVCACAVTFVIAPAHLNAGHDLWLVALIFLGGFVPGFLLNYMTMPMVSRVFLNLPLKARETSKAAMEYARNLPRDAELDIRYLKPWGLEGSIKAKVSEFEPAKGNVLRPLTFRWMGKFAKQKGGLIRNPTSFYVNPKSATGEASKDTIPGIWESVYRRLVSAESNSVARWDKMGPRITLR